MFRCTTWETMKSLFIIGLFCCLIFASLRLYAQDARLFYATVPVDGPGAAASADGKRNALERVLIRITGDESINVHEAVQSVLANADDYTTRFEFSRKQSTAAESQLLMNVHFDSQSLLASLKSAGIPVWDAPRPRVLAWIAVDSLDERYFLDAVSRQQYGEVLFDQADIRGLSVLLPLMDLIDLEYADVHQVIERSSSSLKLASERYDPDITMILRMLTDPSGGWQIRWELRQGELVDTQVGKANTLSAGIRLGINWTADHIVASSTETSAPALKTGQKRWVQVNSVSDFNAYVDLIDFFSQINGVSSVQLVRMETESMLFSIHGDVSWRQLLGVVRSSSRLAELDSSDLTVLRLSWKG